MKAAGFTRFATASALAICAFSHAASAAIITPVDVTSNVGAFSAPGNLITGGGLTGGGDLLTQLHEDRSGNGGSHNWKGVTADLGSANLDFDLGGVHLVSDIHIWNYDDIYGWRTARDVTALDVFASLDGTTFTSLGSLSLTTSTEAEAAQTFAISPTLAAFVRLTVTANNGDAYEMGLGEVRFSGTSALTEAASVSEPLSLALVGLGLGVAGMRRRAS